MKTYKPVTPTRRFMVTADFSGVTSVKPEKSLLVPIKSSGGRNNLGRVTVRRRGGGHKRFYRIIDFKREKIGVLARVDSIQYDPNRSARIALLFYRDGEKRYIISPEGLNVGDEIMSGPEAEIRPGNTLPLSKIPLGTMVHAIEMKPGKGAQIARSAGAGCQIMAREAGMVTLQDALVRNAYVPRELHGHCGPGGECRPSERELGQGGKSRWKDAGRKSAVL